MQFDGVQYTPLGKAAAALSDASDAICSAYHKLQDEHDWWGYGSFELEPDEAGRGYVLTLDYDGPAENPAEIADKMRGLLRERGVTTVRCVRYVADDSAV